MPWWPENLPEPRRSQIRNRIIELRNQGLAYLPIANALNAEFDAQTDRWAVGKAINQAIKAGLLQPKVREPDPPPNNPTWFWSEEEVAILKAGWAAGDSYKQLHAKLPQRSILTIERKRRDLGLLPRKHLSWWEKLDEEERQKIEHDKFIPYTISELAARFGVWKANIRRQLKDRGIRFPVNLKNGPVCWLDKLSPEEKQQHFKGNISLLAPVVWAKRLNINPNTVYDTFKARGIDWPGKGRKIFVTQKPSVAKSSPAKSSHVKPPCQAKPPPPPPPPTQSVEEWLRNHQITKCPERPARGVSVSPNSWERILDRWGK